MAAFQSRMLGLGMAAAIFVLGSDSASAVTLMESAVVWSLVPRSCSRSSLGLLQRLFRRFSLRLSWLVCSRCCSLLFLLFLTSPSIFIPLPPHSHPSPVSPSLPLFILDTFFLLSFSILLPSSPQRNAKLCSAPSSTPTQFPLFLPLPAESLIFSCSLCPSSVSFPHFSD